ncbi:MAG: hypothetical protein ACOYVJ_12335, partial [Nitrospirota bacterium]
LRILSLGGIFFIGFGLISFLKFSDLIRITEAFSFYRYFRPSPNNGGRKSQTLEKCSRPTRVHSMAIRTPVSLYP